MALAAGEPGRWDDRAIWTGSIIEREGTCYFFYTGTNHAEEGRIQRIGLTTSTDLIHWQRHPSNPLVAADARWYETLELGSWPEETCRDPWVIRSPAEAAYYMFFTARVNHGPVDGRGVIGCARSRDLLTWEMLPPVSQSGEFGYLEVPQVIPLEGRFYMLFCTAASKHAAQRLARTGPGGQWSGTGYLVAEKLTGPYRLADDAGLVADDRGTYYAGKLIEDPGGQWVFLAWRRWDEDGNFVGGLSDPAPVHVLADGSLAVKMGNCD